MAQKTNSKGARATRSGSKNSSNNKGVTKKSKVHSKALGRATKSKIDKLNLDASEIDAVRASLNEIGKVKKQIKALDASDLKAGLLRDKEERRKNSEAKKDLEKQLDLMGGLGL